MPNGCTHAAVPKEVALRLFQKLSSEGAFPVMCQQYDASFHVCYEGQQKGGAYGAPERNREPAALSSRIRLASERVHG